MTNHPNRRKRPMTKRAALAEAKKLWGPEAAAWSVPYTSERFPDRYMVGHTNSCVPFGVGGSFEEAFAAAGHAVTPRRNDQ